MTIATRSSVCGRTWIVGTAVLLPLAVLLSGCTPGASSTWALDSSECAQAFDKLQPVEATGMFILVSDKVAETLNHCGSVAEWNSALMAHPTVVGAESVAAEKLNEYLSSACGFLPEDGAKNSACVEARASGFIS